jgi:hypothetical protein
MKRKSRFGIVAAKSYLCPAPDTTNLANLAAKQAREGTTMFAPTAFAPQVLVTKLRQMIVIHEPIVGVQCAFPGLV